MIPIDIKEAAHQAICNFFTRNIKGLLGDVYHHSERVCDYALLIADGYGLHLQDRIDLAIGSLTHDIGKSYVNPEILNKATTLTKDDWVIIERHPQQGYLAVRDTDLSPIIAEITLHHHERLDGSGYPEHLRGKEIPLLVQIVSVADVFDALTSDRVYHDKITKKEAFAIMRKEKGLNQVAISVLEQALQERKE